MTPANARRATARPAPLSPMNADMNVLKWLTFFAIAQCATGGDAFGQTDANCVQAGAAHTGSAAVLDDYYRVASLRSTAPTLQLIRRGSSPPADHCGDQLWRVVPAPDQPVSLTQTRLDVIYNSAYPRGGSLGLLWAGRGLSTLISTGATARFGRFSAALEPEIAMQQNLEFPFVQVVGVSEYAYPWHSGIDWPLRHGGESSTTIAAGQSYARVDFPWLDGGISTENLWWGPGMRNAIVLGNDAAGFPHVFVGSGEGWNSPVGRFNAEAVWGRLSESEYFDTISANDHRFFAGLNVVWSPRWSTGLSLGGARIFQTAYEPGSFSVGDYFPFLQSPLKRDLATPENPSGNNSDDQMISFFARYAPPSSGLEAYVEWARTDHSANMQDFYAEPDHSAAYTLGFQRVWGGTSRWYRLRGELTDLNTVGALGRPLPDWYVHTDLTAGYTHRGKILGAHIGPGSDAQYMGFDVFTRQGRHGFFLERVRHDENAYFRWITKVHLFRAHDVELTGGTEHVYQVGQFMLTAGLSFSSRRNRDFRYCNHLDTAPEFCQAPHYRDKNWHIPLGVIWQPRD